jgi:hypothetical protein
MFFGKDTERMPTDCSKLENAGSLELSRLAWPGIPGNDLRSPTALARFGKLLVWNGKLIQVMSVTPNGR